MRRRRNLRIVRHKACIARARSRRCAGPADHRLGVHGLRCSSRGGTIRPRLDRYVPRSLAPLRAELFLLSLGEHGCRKTLSFTDALDLERSGFNDVLDALETALHVWIAASLRELALRARLAEEISA